MAVKLPVDDASGDFTEALNSPSELVVVAAGLSVAERPPNSRRLAATATHASGAAAGAPPSLPAPNHANKLSRNPDTERLAGAAVIAGAAAAAATAAGGATTVAAADGRWDTAKGFAAAGTSAGETTGAAVADSSLGITRGVVEWEDPFDGTVTDAGSLTGADLATGALSAPRRGRGANTGAVEAESDSAPASPAGSAAGTREPVAGSGAVAVCDSAAVDPDRPVRVVPVCAVDRDVFGAEEPPVF